MDVYLNEKNVTELYVIIASKFEILFISAYADSSGDLKLAEKILGTIESTDLAN